MMLLGLLVGMAVVLAGLVYVAKRHFGLPVMGLAVGMVMRQLWAADVVPYAAGVGIGSLVPPVDETSKMVVAALDGSHAAVVTMGFACALVDTLVARAKGAKPHKKK